MANIIGTSAPDLLIGVASAGDDTVSGLAGDDVLAGEAGNDVLSGGTGINILIGGTLDVTEDVGTVVLHAGDRDTVSYAERNQTVRVTLSDTATLDITRFGIAMHLTGVGREGDNGQGDILVGIENLIGSSYTDVLTGDSKDNILYGKGGSDDLIGGGGNDILAGGDKDDILIGGAGADLLIDGDLTIANGIGTVTNSVNNFNTRADYGTSTAGVNIDLTAVQTVDVTRAGVSFHLENAVAGHGGEAEGDWLVGAGIGILIGSQFNDHLVGDGHAQQFHGGAGDDVLQGSFSMTGEAGNDMLIAGQYGSNLEGDAGADILDGRAGTDDTAYYWYSAGITIDLTQGTAHGGDAEGDVLMGIENVDATEEVDRLIGSASNEHLVLYGGNDSSYGLGGNDLVGGGDGNDRLVGGAGADVIGGGDGFDWAYYHTSAAGVTVNLATGTGSGGEAQGDTLSGIEAIYGSIHDDTLTGSDTSDTLLGNTGADHLTGGGYADTFMYRAVSDSTVATAGRDVILDFSRAQGDKIDLVAIDADGNAANGNTAFVYTAGGAFTGIGHEVVVQNGGTGISLLYADLDGDKVADFAIEVHSPIPITGQDMVL